MINSKISLADLKESNINQLIASDMLMVRGGCGKRRQSRNKCGRGNSFTKRRGNGGCTSGGVTPTPAPTPAPAPISDTQI